MRDVQLDRVAQANSAALAEVDQPPTGATAFLKFLLEKEGVKDAVVHGVAVRLEDGPLPGQLATALAPATGGSFTHFGVGRSGGVVTVVLARRLVEVQLAHSRGQVQLCVSPRPGVRRPCLLVTFPNGHLFERSWSGSRRCFRLPGQRGRHQVEVMVEGAYGPEVAALFPLYVGVAPPTLPSHKLYPQGDQEHVEIRLMRLVNRSRKALGLPSLRPSRVLARVARHHSQDMLARGYFGHVSPTRGNLARRLVRQGVRYEQASENLSLATSPRKAHDSLMASPSHRRTLLDPEATHVGIGVATDPARGLLYVTQIFASF